MLFALSIAVGTLFMRLYLDHVEVNIACVSWLWAEGLPLHHAADSPERYSLLYGPWTYVLTGLFMKLVGPSVLSSRIPSTITVLVAMASSFIAFRRDLSMKASIALTGYLFSIMFLEFGANTVSIRPDTWIISSVCLAIAASRRIKGSKAFLLCGIAAGFAFNLKVHALLYFAPLALESIRQYRFRGGLSFVAGLLITVPLPFFIPGISLPPYLYWLQAARDHGLNSAVGNLKVAQIFVLPMVGLLIWIAGQGRRAFASYWRDHWSMLLGLAVATPAISIIAAKPGSGLWHLAPLFPSFFFAGVDLVRSGCSSFATRSSWRARLAIALLAGNAASAMSYGVTSWNGVFTRYREMLTSPSSGEIAEVREMQRRFAGLPIQMGYGSYDEIQPTFVRALLVFDRNPLLIDVTALMDMEKSGLPIPPATFRAVEADASVWLFPKGSVPFCTLNAYAPHTRLFPAEFTEAFLGSHALVSSGAYYDVYMPDSMIR
jgi:hypothetical protein